MLSYDELPCKLEIKSIWIIFRVGVYYCMHTYQQQIKQYIDIGFATFIQLTTWVYIQFKYTQNKINNNRNISTRKPLNPVWCTWESCPFSCLRVDFIIKTVEQSDVRVSWSVGGAKLTWTIAMEHMFVLDIEK